MQENMSTPPAFRHCPCWLKFSANDLLPRLLPATTNNRRSHFFRKSWPGGAELDTEKGYANRRRRQQFDVTLRHLGGRYDDSKTRSSCVNKRIEIRHLVTTCLREFGSVVDHMALQMTWFNELVITLSRWRNSRETHLLMASARKSIFARSIRLWSVVKRYRLDSKQGR